MEGVCPCVIRVSESVLFGFSRREGDVLYRARLVELFRNDVEVVGVIVPAEQESEFRRTDEVGFSIVVRGVCVLRSKSDGTIKRIVVLFKARNVARDNEKEVAFAEQI